MFWGERGKAGRAMTTGLDLLERRNVGQVYQRAQRFIAPVLLCPLQIEFSEPHEADGFTPKNLFRRGFVGHVLSPLLPRKLMPISQQQFAGSEEGTVCGHSITGRGKRKGWSRSRIFGRTKKKTTLG
jgi:hypothetical protein